MKSWSAECRGALRALAAVALSSLSIAGIVGSGTAAAAAPPKVTSPRLYILDCGTISPMDPKLYFSLEKSEVRATRASSHRAISSCTRKAR